MSIMLFLAIACGWGDEGPPNQAQESARRAEIVKIAAAKAQSVDVIFVDDEVEAKLRARPLLSWSNPTIGSIYGDVFLWSHHGQPVAIASIYR